MKIDEVLQMTESQLEAAFDAVGYSILYEKLKYKIWVAFNWKEDDPDILERFLSAYAFEEDEEIHCNEFLFHYKIYKNIVEKNHWN